MKSIRLTGTMCLAIALIAAAALFPRAGAGDAASISPAQAGFSVCPPAGGWAMAVWTGANNTPTVQAIATCTSIVVTSVFYFDHLTQGWLFFFALAPEAATLRTLANLQPVFLQGGTGTPGPTPTATPTPTPTPTTLPFVDAHNHIMPGLTSDLMISRMDETGVSKIVLMAKGGPVSEVTQLTLDAQARFPSRVIPFIGLNQVSTITLQVLSYLDSQLATGKFQGMGELLVLHYGFSAQTPSGPVEAPTVEIPLDSPGAQDIMCLAAKHNVVLTIHMETTDQTVAKLEWALQRNPTTKVIWAHQTHAKTLNGSAPENAGQADPEQIAALLDKFPNLYADLAPGYESIFNLSNYQQLPDRWRSLYERYSDRFVVGLDMPFIENWQHSPTILNRASIIRSWLSQLSPETQRKFASENIERILTARPANVQTCQFMTQ